LPCIKAKARPNLSDDGYIQEMSVLQTLITGKHMFRPAFRMRLDMQ
jgi:hypothetical protein